MSDAPETPTFNAALRRLEPQIVTPEPTGERLASARTLRHWRAGKLPPPLLILRRYPELLRALLADAERVGPNP